MRIYDEINESESDDETTMRIDASITDQNTTR